MQLFRSTYAGKITSLLHAKPVSERKRGVETLSRTRLYGWRTHQEEHLAPTRATVATKKKAYTPYEGPDLGSSEYRPKNNVLRNDDNPIQEEHSKYSITYDLYYTHQTLQHTGRPQTMFGLFGYRVGFSRRTGHVRPNNYR